MLFYVRGLEGEEKLRLMWGSTNAGEVREVSGLVDYIKVMDKVPGVILDMTNPIQDDEVEIQSVSFDAVVTLGMLLENEKLERWARRHAQFLLAVNRDPITQIHLTRIALG